MAASVAGRSRVLPPVFSYGILAALVAVGLSLLASPSAEALPRSAILKLRQTAAAHYQPTGGSMRDFTVFVVRGKAFASTLGEVSGTETVAVWELDGGQWQFVFDHPRHPPEPRAVNAMYRNYGFTWKQQSRLNKNWKKF